MQRQQVPQYKGGRRAAVFFGTMSALAIASSLAACGGSDSSDSASSSTPPPHTATPTASAESKCQAMLNMQFGEATITKSTFVQASGALPERCVVVGHMPKDLSFEMNLPTVWNERQVFSGGGGFDGLIPPDPRVDISPNLKERGYVTIASNHGHTSAGNATSIGGIDAEFALDQDMLNDYAFLSVPRVIGPARAVMTYVYGEQKVASSKSIYEGCSGGGRQALLQAQRNPTLFDGIIARAPANAYIPQFLYYQKSFKQLAQPGAALSTAKIKTIAKAVLNKCDSLDGLKDNIIGKPDACQFDIAELRCTGAETDACLTDTQVASAKSLYEPTNVASGRYTWPGFPFGGGEDGSFGTPIWGNAIAKGLMDGFIKYMVARDAAVDSLQLDPAQYTTRLDELSSLINAVNPDLSQFRAKGGKLLLWHGMADWLITPNNTINYYNAVVAAAGGQAAADQFMEFYTAPGVNHCALGNGADNVDLVGPMFEWLEKGTPPSTNKIVAQTFYAPPGTTRITRPLCRYPQYPKYNGTGDPNVESSFTCTGPSQ
ncbi:tannase/feruloyl esterase family alpha/beta hydrolase (plasmid) [Cupriavidus necator]|uniref:Tannase/feruloyl esterase family alpha/beta hydrolase n=1 Tax=Cupriavidus necator TaxID=106590 RepID=A0A367PKF5_CUPNE|nr:tannase/feruloyl esterase family alpha/beta hydrolase [Cupriavidus necator]QQX89241.1 tannase/feruloyl esterase family alpha/beta hydrolase [Cupriavidus necator]RCJ08392.1 tannase/feruloyl esterase family alpha/beta hydrolase [Cupriavidus necator]